MNEAIRRKAAANGVRLWQVADGLKISEPTLSRWLRHELNDEKKSEILEIIDKLKAGDFE